MKLDRRRTDVSRLALRGPLLAALVIAGAFVSPAVAGFHLMLIQEVFVGTPEDGTNPNLTPDQRAQYIVLRMTSGGQTFVSGARIRVEDASGNVLGNFGTFTANVAQGGGVCSYPSCPAIILGTQAAKNLFTFTFDKIVNGQTARKALPARGGRACMVSGTSVVDCVAWGNFSCTAANCPGGPNALHTGDTNPNACDQNYGTPAAPGTGILFGHVLAHKNTFTCAVKDSANDYTTSPQQNFPRPVNNAGANNNTDTDGDGLIDQLDCCPSGAGCDTILWKAIEVQNQAVTKLGLQSTDAWSSQADTAGTGVTYDEVRGTLANLNGFTDDACQLGDTTTTSSPDTSVPTAGTGYYYLVRAGSGDSCVGTYGSAARDAGLTTCP